jgi:hypothetical protein
VDKALETKQQEEENFNYQKMLDKREANKKAQEQLKKEETAKYVLFFVLIAFNNNFLQVIYAKLYIVVKILKFRYIIQC